MEVKMEKFWELWEKSTIVSGLIALAMVGASIYCIVAGITLPDYFQIALGVIIGFFFSDKAKKADK